MGWVLHAALITAIGSTRVSLQGGFPRTWKLALSKSPDLRGTDMKHLKVAFMGEVECSMEG